MKHNIEMSLVERLSLSQRSVYTKINQMVVLCIKVVLISALNRTSVTKNELLKRLKILSHLTSGEEHKIK